MANYPLAPHLRAYLLAAIAQATGSKLEDLPMLDDQELWDAYKLISQSEDEPQELPEEIYNLLNDGEQFNLFIGTFFDLPQPGCDDDAHAFAELLEKHRETILDHEV